MVPLKVIHCLPQLAVLSVCVTEDAFGRQKESHSFLWDRFSVEAVRYHWICIMYFVVVNHAGFSVHFNFHFCKSLGIKVDLNRNTSQL